MRDRDEEQEGVHYYSYHWPVPSQWCLVVSDSVWWCRDFTGTVTSVTFLSFKLVRRIRILSFAKSHSASKSSFILQQLNNELKKATEAHCRVQVCPQTCSE